MSKLLFDESPLVVQPTLAKAIGLNEAIVLQQINYWMNTKGSGKMIRGQRWVYNTVKEWQEQFPFWSEATITRTLNNLEDAGLIQTGTYNQSRTDRTKWYTIDFAVVELLDALISQERDMTNAFSQNDKMDISNLQESILADCVNIPETSQRLPEIAAAIETTYPTPPESFVRPDIIIESGEESAAEKEITQVIFSLGWKERNEIREMAKNDDSLLSLKETIPQFREKVSDGTYRATWGTLKKFWVNTIATNRLRAPIANIPDNAPRVNMEAVILQ